MCTLIADVAANPPEVLGVGLSASQGLRRGQVVDLSALVSALDTSLRRAEQQSGFKAVRALVSIADPSARSTLGSGAVTVRDASGEIRPTDVAGAARAAGELAAPAEHEVVHLLRRAFVVDGVSGILDPVGMVGRRLEAESCVVTVAAPAVQAMMRAVRSLKLELDALVLDPLAGGYAVLRPEERDRGALVVDIGGGTTGLAIYYDGNPLYAAILPAGGEQITSDIAFGLRTGNAGAEELKLVHGSTLARAHDGEVAIQVIGQPRATLLSQRTVAEIVDARLAEIFELACTRVIRDGYGDAFPAGIVVTGGTAPLPGAVGLAAEIFGVRARLGTPARVRGLADTLQGPAYATSLGLLAWGQDRMEAAATHNKSRARPTWQSGFLGWIRGFWG